VAVLGLLVTALVTGCSSKSSAGRSGVIVSVRSLMFMPATLRIPAGTKVTWHNDEPITHTVTSGPVTGIDRTSGLRSGQRRDGRFDARLAGKGDTFSYVFTKPGTYSYYCDIHFGMNAQVIVTG